MSNSKPKIFALIPARGGSKGVPRKNLRYVGGKPLVAHSIEQALLCESIQRVFVSTDDAEIAEVAKRFSAEVIHRPAELSNDTASSEAAVLHFLESLPENEQPDFIVFLQCTSPLTRATDIEGAILKLQEAQADSAFTVTPFHHFLWKKLQGSSEVEPIDHSAEKRKRRQDLDASLLETGSVYVMRSQAFREFKTRFCGKTVGHEISPERCWEIDSETDLEICELMMRKTQRSERLSALPNLTKALVMDFDGVFTDNSAFVDQEGVESVKVSRLDGLGFSKISKTDIKLLVLSKEQNPVVQRRCEKLNLPFRQGIDEKLAVFQSWIRENGLSRDEVVYVGNDENDKECLDYAGCGVVVQDAYPSVKPLASIILDAKGGEGAMRELIEMILERNKNA